jgi:hypothetical protein
MGRTLLHVQRVDHGTLFQVGQKPKIDRENNKNKALPPTITGIHRVSMAIRPEEVR